MTTLTFGRLSSDLRSFRRSRRAVLALCAAAALSACTTGRVAPSSGTVSQAKGAPSSAGGGGGSSPSVGPAVAGAPGERMLVRRGSLSIETERPGDVSPRAAALASAVGGYVQSSTESSDGDVHVTLRVPAPSLDAALDTLARLGRVRGRTVSADDVTEQLVDLEARLTTLRASRDRLRELQQRAGTVADLLVAERELTRVQGEIDSLEGRLKFVRGSVALAELTLSARRPVKLGPIGALFAGLGKLVGKLFVL
jgi:hypothetical protein